MRVGIIGLGHAGSFHLDAWQSVPGADVVAICDPLPAGRRRAASANIDAYADLGTTLQHGRLDVVSICTPPADHVDTAMACLEHGIHVLCEKPLATTTWDALAMLQTASRKRRQLLLATKFRHVPEVATLRDMITAGDIGEPVFFEVSFCSPVDMAKRWNAQPQRAGGGVIIDNGSHAFDLVAFLFGSVVRVHATVLRPLQQIPVEDSATIQVQAADGVVGKIDLSWSLSTGRDSYVVVHGSRGTVEIGWRGSRVRTAAGEWQTMGGPYDKASAQRRMHTWFMEAIAGSTEGWITARESLGAVAAVDAAYRSVESERWEWVEVKAIAERRTGT